MGWRSALVADWPLKLTSLALSVLLWLFASSEETASGLLDVELQVQPPAGRAVVRAPERLRATVVGPRRDLLKLGSTPLILTRLLPDTLGADSVQLEFTPLDVVLPRGVTARVQDLEPRRLTVELDPVEQRVVPVRPVVRVAPDSGFELDGGVAVLPGEVRVAGPRELVARVDSVWTMPVLVRSATGPRQERVAVDTAALAGVRVVPSRVTVSLNAQATGERTFGAVPVQLPSTSSGGWRPSPEVVRVRVLGPRTRLGALTDDSVAVTVDRPAAGAHRAGLRVFAPSGLRATVNPDSVTLVRRTARG